MVVIMRDAVMPECCNTCVCSEGYGCGITGTEMTTKEMEERPDWCPLEEVEPCEDAVSRYRLLNDLKELTIAWEKYPVMAEQIKGVETTIGYVKTIPSVTPKQPILCGECKHYKQDSQGIPYCYKHRGYGWDWDDFCSRAERREE